MNIGFLPLALVACGVATAAPIANLPGLQSITVIEGTGVAITHVFTPGSAAMTNQPTGPLSTVNNDFQG